MPHIHHIGPMNLNEIVGKRIIYLTECHMSQEWIIRNQMYLEIFTLPFYIPDIITFHTNETMVTLQISYIIFYS